MLVLQMLDKQRHMDNIDQAMSNINETGQQGSQDSKVFYYFYVSKQYLSSTRLNKQTVVLRLQALYSLLYCEFFFSIIGIRLKLTNYN